MSEAAAQLTAAAAEIVADLPTFCELLQIRVKTGPPITFGYDNWYSEQKQFERERTGRDLVLKARQVGFSTLELARDLQYAMLHTGSQVQVIVQSDEVAQALFQTLHIFCDSLGVFCPRRKYSSRREIVFAAPLNSAVRIVEAGATEGKPGTDLSNDS